jgi:hypothetical protein
MYSGALIAWFLLVGILVLIVYYSFVSTSE